MANQRLIDTLLKRQEEETKIEVDLLGLADTPFYVKLSKGQYKAIEKEAEFEDGGETKASPQVYKQRVDALCVARSLHDHNEEPVFGGELYEALGTWDAVEAVGNVLNLAEERLIQAAILECMGYVDRDKITKENDELKN